MKVKAKIVIVASFLMIAALGLLYTLVVPLLVSRSYSSQARAIAEPLENAFRDLGESTELPLFTDSNASDAAIKNNVVLAQELITESRHRLRLLKAASNTYSHLPYSDVAGQYQSADKLRHRVDRMIAQSEAALNEYEVLIEKLQTLHQVADEVSRELDAFNKETDLNNYGGQSDTLNKVSSNIRASATLLAEDASTSDLEDFVVAIVDAMNEAAQGFEELAAGIAIPADDPIYAAARKVESATANLETATSSLYDKGIVQSRSIKNIQDLDEKIEPILEE